MSHSTYTCRCNCIDTHNTRADSHGTTSGQQQHYVQVCCIEFYTHQTVRVHRTWRHVSAPLNVVTELTESKWNHMEISPSLRSHITWSSHLGGDITLVEISLHVEMSPYVHLSPHVQTSPHVEISPHWRFHLTWRSHFSGDLPEVELSPHAPQFSQIGKNMKGQGAGSFTPLTKQHVPEPTVKHSPLIVNVLLIIPTPHFRKIPQKA